MKSVLAGTAALVLSACGSMGGSSSATAGAYDQLASSVSRDMASYCDANAAASTPEDCRAAVAAHAARMQDVIDRMKAMAAQMDGEMSSMHMSGSADAQCGTNVMAGELARHLEAACVATDAAVNQAEFARHCAAMAEYVDHMHMRAAQMTSMAGHGGMMMSTGMMASGSTIPDGGMMGWDHTLAGCEGARP